MTFVEGKLEFEFSSAWDGCVKFDEHIDYLNAEKLDGFHGVDFVGVLNGILFLIEVKDFRGHRIENKDKFANHKLAIQIGRKVKDSIACIIAANHNSNVPIFWQPHKNILCDPQGKIRVIVWLEQDRPRTERDSRIQGKMFENQVKRKLRWLTRRVQFVNVATQSDRLNFQVRNR